MMGAVKTGRGRNTGSRRLRLVRRTLKPRSRCGAATTRPPKHFGSSSRNCSSTSSHCAASEPSSPAPISATRYPATTTTP